MGNVIMGNVIFDSSNVVEVGDDVLQYLTYPNTESTLHLSFRLIEYIDHRHHHQYYYYPTRLSITTLRCVTGITTSETRAAGFDL